MTPAREVSLYKCKVCKIVEIPVSVIAFPKTQQRNWNPAKESNLRIYTEVDQGREKKLNNPRFKNLAAGQRGRPLPSPRAFLYQISVAQDLWVPPCSAIRKHHHSAQGAKERKSHLLQAATKRTCLKVQEQQVCPKHTTKVARKQA